MTLELKKRLGLNLEVVNTEMMYKAMRVYNITEGETEPSKLLCSIVLQKAVADLCMDLAARNWKP